MSGALVESMPHESSQPAADPPAPFPATAPLQTQPPSLLKQPSTAASSSSARASPIPTSRVKNWKTICHHNRRKTQCVLCFDMGIGGGSICPHRKRRDVCLLCRRPADAATGGSAEAGLSYHPLHLHSPPSPLSADRTASGAMQADQNLFRQSKSCSATPVLEAESTASEPVEGRPPKTDGTPSRTHHAPTITSATVVPPRLKQETLMATPLQPPPRHPYAYGYAPNYTAYYDALDYLYYERARAAAAHQHYLSAAAAANAAAAAAAAAAGVHQHNYYPYWATPTHMPVNSTTYRALAPPPPSSAHAPMTVPPPTQAPLSSAYRQLTAAAAAPPIEAYVPPLGHPLAHAAPAADALLTHAVVASPAATPTLTASLPVPPPAPAHAALELGSAAGFQDRPTYRTVFPIEASRGRPTS
ncbi:hypothetical protein HK405_016042 [Cladochytrium tenue]|nr:hypothetical protein HK405_016042 [Cladochytrium tenue]